MIAPQQCPSAPHPPLQTSHLDLGSAADPAGTSSAWHFDVASFCCVLLPSVLCLHLCPAQPYDVILLDEAQDVNPLTQNLIMSQVRPAGRQAPAHGGVRPPTTPAGCQFASLPTHVAIRHRSACTTCDLRRPCTCGRVLGTGTNKATKGPKLATLAWS